LVGAGAELSTVANAAIDVSDGLAADLGHVADASGARAVLDATALEQALDRRLRKTASLLQRDPLELALFGGEDYALIATGPSSKRPPLAHAIGQIEKGRGVWLRTPRATKRLSRSGFDHFV
jgi:thiamine-monophosphate kinase